MADSVSKAIEDAADVVIDASGLKCPLPVLKARKAIKSMETGAVLEITSTDPASPLDFKHWCRSSGHDMLSAEERETDRYVFRIRKIEGS